MPSDSQYSGVSASASDNRRRAPLRDDETELVREIVAALVRGVEGSHEANSGSSSTDDKRMSSLASAARVSLVVDDVVVVAEVLGASVSSGASIGGSVPPGRSERTDSSIRHTRLVGVP